MRGVQEMKETAREKEGIGTGTRTHFIPFVGALVFHLSLGPSRNAEGLFLPSEKTFVRADVVG